MVIRLIWFLGLLLIGRRRKILRLALLTVTFIVGFIFRRRRMAREVSAGP
jgi:hypothetical protein